MGEENVCMMCSGMEADDAIDDAGLGPLRASVRCRGARLKAKQLCPSGNFFNAAVPLPEILESAGVHLLWQP